MTNRTRARAEELAGRFGASVADWEDLAGALTAADIVIASTGAQRPVLTRALLSGVQRAPKATPLCLIDIAVAARRRAGGGSSTGSTWPTSTICKGGRPPSGRARGRGSARPRHRRAELARFVRALARPPARAHGDRAPCALPGPRRSRSERAGRPNRGLDDRAKKAILEAADGFAKKLLHQPQMALRQDDGDGVPLVLAVQRLFKLQVGDGRLREVEETEAADGERGGKTAAADASNKQRANGG